MNFEFAGEEPLLVVGHTTHESAQIWLCGGPLAPSAEVTLRRALGTDGNFGGLRRIDLPAPSFTNVHTFDHLEPRTTYQVSARFGKTEVRGGFRTPPPPGAGDPFRFLVGSCNLSVVTLTNLGGLLAAAVGILATTQSLERTPGSGFLVLLRKVFRKVVSFVAWGGFALIRKISRFEQPAPLLPSPFSGLLDFLRRRPGPLAPAFSLFAGDQIYFDFPFPRRLPSAAEYRRTYRQAWSEDRALRALLSQMPHYMTLDDHEIVDAFATDTTPRHWVRKDGSAATDASRGPLLARLCFWKQAEPQPTAADYLAAGTLAYREFVDVRHPSRPGELFYHFSHGRAHFFVLDTRTERRQRQGEMIGRPQLERLKDWLRERKGDPLFVVSSVPFVAELSASSREEEAPDKWSSWPYRRQRDEILEYVFEQRVDGLVFLVGDMHCTYQASMRIGPPAKRLTIHEIASGPFHQLDYPKASEFRESFRDRTAHEQRLVYATAMHRFQSAASSLVEIEVDPKGGRLRWWVLPTHARASEDGPTFGGELRIGGGP